MTRMIVMYTYLVFNINLYLFIRKAFKRLRIREIWVFSSIWRYYRTINYFFRNQIRFKLLYQNGLHYIFGQPLTANSNCRIFNIFDGIRGGIDNSNSWISLPIDISLICVPSTKIKWRWNYEVSLVLVFKWLLIDR